MPHGSETWTPQTFSDAAEIISVGKYRQSFPHTWQEGVLFFSWGSGDKSWMLSKMGTVTPFESIPIPPRLTAYLLLNVFYLGQEVPEIAHANKVCLFLLSSLCLLS